MNLENKSIIPTG